MTPTKIEFTRATSNTADVVRIAIFFDKVPGAVDPVYLADLFVQQTFARHVRARACDLDGAPFVTIRVDLPNRPKKIDGVRNEGGENRIKSAIAAIASRVPDYVPRIDERCFVNSVPFGFGMFENK